MTASNLARRAYGPANDSTRSARSVEFEVIARITHRLKKAIQTKDTNDLFHAIYENRRLWNMLAADVVSPKNQLPEDLRARIFYLAEFTNVHSRRVLKEKASAVPLLEINAAIISGLNDRVETT